MKLKGLNVQKFFEWLSKSPERVSESKIGTNIKLDPIDDWADDEWNITVTKISDGGELISWGME